VREKPAGLAPAGFSFARCWILAAIAHLGCLLILPFKFLFRRHRRDRPSKSGDPPLFAPALKVQRDDTHNDSMFAVIDASIAKHLPGAVRMAMGASVFRIRIDLIFRRCWNLVTPLGRSAANQRRLFTSAATSSAGAESG
jgi:hypothetical protein